jgi:1,4-dihydroxy-2-naphthoate polyprenyltransferase
MIEEKRKNLTPLQIWILAARPKTLPAAAAPVIVGSSLAFRDGLFNPLPALAALLAALLLQIGANLANDLFDYYRGADTSKRLGPLRVTSAGLLAPEQVRGGMLLTFFLAALLGIYLTAVAGWVVVLIGLAAIAAAVAYTGGPFPFGYYGLGDLFVFIFFGLAAVGGTYYVQAGSLTAAAVWSAAPMGLLITALLVVNNSTGYRNRPPGRQAHPGSALWGKRRPGRVRAVPGRSLPDPPFDGLSGSVHLPGAALLAFPAPGDLAHPGGLL